jgi:hypothetical protein
VWPALVVGAGPAGLATSGELSRLGIPHVVLERGDSLAYQWTRLYESLTLHTGKHLSALPGMSFPRATPLFPTRLQFLDYLNEYARSLRLPVRTGCSVTAVERSRDGWRLTTPQGDLRARRLVVATGILSNPIVPVLPGRELFRGRLMHSIEYHSPGPFRSRRVLVVGAGNSAGEISAELARAGARVTVAVRSGALALPRQILGIPIQYFAVLMTKLPVAVQQSFKRATGVVSEWLRGPPVLPRPPRSACPEVPLIGHHMVDAIRDGSIQLRRGITGMTEEGVRFQDGSLEPFDDVILGTGYRAAVGFMEGLIKIDDCGFARRTKRVVSLDQPDLYFVGHNYDTTGGLYNIRRDSTLVAKTLAAQGAQSEPSPDGPTG